MIQGIQKSDDVASSLSSAKAEVKFIQDTVIEMRGVKNLMKLLLIWLVIKPRQQPTKKLNIFYHLI
ncbi:hypothetical protein [Microseira wollei]|uniref:Uncharacterized protein n=1 Tax=Microseira wollei NIES-4236 TaxID=2530354 RepID=A0AAV3XSV4_9CYAN|nr:hypothetical protein [Microseira wollei]GET44219.1 hypothetical protein MiSe_90450 [Microseira wollei NIES-4236]